jgi:hypothetical protein
MLGSASYKNCVPRRKHQRGKGHVRRASLRLKYGTSTSLDGTNVALGRAYTHRQNRCRCRRRYRCCQRYNPGLLYTHADKIAIGACKTLQNVRSHGRRVRTNSAYLSRGSRHDADMYVVVLITLSCRPRVLPSHKDYMKYQYHRYRRRGQHRFCRSVYARP